MASFGSGLDLDTLIAKRNANARYVVQYKKVFYLFDVDTLINPTGVLWVRNIKDAFKFPDEESVEDFIMDFVYPRRVQIIRLEKR